ncbi:hypothetical protein [Sphingomonas sp. C3-2]|uniref:hypothetical protein n=1 Tax=Sphingomonas sp. C3-2 TaxID=3062169 RepID=UPI00294B5076|nr:hypothetical protein [Sphingomonas sp. C3-2]WOK35478.1 hypothetical protein QYC26_10680 [Sphingomonas sp. C3-2]
MSEKFGGLAVFAVTIIGAFAATPAAAQRGPTNTQVIPMEGANTCPTGWLTGNGTSARPALKHCYPQSNGQSAMAYRKRGSCMEGYGENGDEWCLKGFVTVPEYAAAHKIDKRDIRDRCPAGYHSYKMVCSSQYAEASSARYKGAADCKPTELVEWGLWCVSNYQKLSAIQVSSAAKRDWNNIYTGTRGQSPLQSPDDDYSELYRKLFGEPKAAQSINERVAPGAVGKGLGSTSGNRSEAKPCETGRAVGGMLGGKLGKAIGGAAAGC